MGVADASLREEEVAAGAGADLLSNTHRRTLMFDVRFSYDQLRVYLHILTCEKLVIGRRSNQVEIA